MIIVCAYCVLYLYLHTCLPPDLCAALRFILFLPFAFRLFSPIPYILYTSDQSSSFSPCPIRFPPVTICRLFSSIINYLDLPWIPP